MNLARNCENRLEADALLPNVALEKRFRALADGTDGLDVFLRKAKFIRIDDNTVLLKGKAEARLDSDRISVIFRILNQFVHEPSFLVVELLGDTRMS